MNDSTERRPTSVVRGWPISPTFLALLAALLGLAVVIVRLPQFARLAVFFFVLVAWVISLCLHEFGHALAAYAGGDHNVRAKGYLTLDPVRYTNLQFSIVWPLLFLAVGGIGFPGAAVYVDMRAIRSPVGRTLVAAAGPIATLIVLLVLIAILRTAGAALGPLLYAAVAFLALLQLTALALNLLPVPGLDGWGIIASWLPIGLRKAGARTAGIAPALLFVLFFLVPPANDMFWRGVFDLGHLIDLDVRAAIEGLRLFQFWR